MSTDEALGIGIILGATIALALEHIFLPFGLWLSIRLSRARVRQLR